ncbi:retropepsin-like domain-containing protein [Streptomyces tuirus]|uniref:Retropepsin-like domain-containing protein n=1 Tax=Streptomyces tuirus TaxID=68278 RepID=A0A941J1X8_9ACTN|nr:retropepsin-like domain-containing protein [Streptomyces tuirus]
MSTRDGRAPGGSRRRRRRRLLAALVTPLLFLSAGCVVVEDRDDTGETRTSPGVVREVPLRVVEQGGRTLAFVPVSFEDRGPYMFALDTGASTSVVDEDVADRIGLERTGERRTVSGILGTGEVPVARVDHWEVGELPLPAGEVTVIDLGPPRGGGGIEGLLGSDVLSDFGSITVDYDDGVLRIPPP